MPRVLDCCDEMCATSRTVSYGVCRISTPFPSSSTFAQNVDSFASLRCRWSVKWCENSCLLTSNVGFFDTVLSYVVNNQVSTWCSLLIKRDSKWNCWYPICSVCERKRESCGGILIITSQNRATSHLQHVRDCNRCFGHAGHPFAPDVWFSQIWPF